MSTILLIITHFVDPLTRVHTQKIESYWNKLKLRFKTMKGVSKEPMDGYLAERMFLDRYGGITRRIFIKIIALFAEKHTLFFLVGEGGCGYFYIFDVIVSRLPKCRKVLETPASASSLISSQ